MYTYAHSFSLYIMYLSRLTDLYLMTPWKSSHFSTWGAITWESCRALCIGSLIWGWELQEASWGQWDSPSLYPKPVLGSRTKAVHTAPQGDLEQFGVVPPQHTQRHIPHLQWAAQQPVLSCMRWDLTPGRKGGQDQTPFRHRDGTERERDQLGSEWQGQWGSSLLPHPGCSYGAVRQVSSQPPPPTGSHTFNSEGVSVLHLTFACRLGSAASSCPQGAPDR